MPLRRLESTGHTFLRAQLGRREGSSSKRKKDTTVTVRQIHEPRKVWRVLFRQGNRQEARLRKAYARLAN